VSALNSYSDAEARGIYSDTLLGDIINKGNIIIEASAGDSDVYAATGIYVREVGLGGSINNSGLIKVNIAAAEDYAIGGGISVLGDMAGEISNSGDIILTSTVNGYSGSSFTGIFIKDDLSGSLTNTSTGVIDVSRTVGSSDSSALIGIGAFSVTGTLDNQGQITVTGKGSSATALAYGISVGYVEVGGELLNSGDITVLGVNNASAVGVQIEDLYGTFNNSGSIQAVDETGPSLAIEIQSGSGTFNNLAGGFVQGKNIDIAAGIAVTNAGTLSVLSGGEGNFAGDYTQEESGVLRLGAVSAAEYGKFVVGGTATLASNAKFDVDVSNVNTLAIDEVLTSVLSAVTLDSDGTYRVTDNSSLFNFSGSMNGNAVDLTVVKGTTATEAVANAGLPAAAGAAATFDDLVANGGGTPEMDDAITELGQLGSEQEVAEAVESTIPAMSGGIAQVTNMATAGVTAAVSSRQDAVHGISSGDSMMTDRHLWLKPFGGWAEQDDRKGVTGYDIDSYGRR